jgi:FkbM family methyltransferase
MSQMSTRVRRAVMTTAERFGVEEQAKRLRAMTNAGLRRDLRDHAALRLLLAATLRPGDSAIEVGAHTGDVLRDIVRLAPDGQHLAFEPLPDLFAGLEREFGAQANVALHRLALADERGETTFQHVLSAPGYSGLRRRDLPGTHEVREIPVQVERLDDVVPAGFVPRFMKVDVEGAELEVLRGARETLARHRPLLVFEHGQGGIEHYGGTPGALHDLLVGDCGMRVFDLAGEGPYSRERFVEVFAEPIWNFLAR